LKPTVDGRGHLLTIAGFVANQFATNKEVSLANDICSCADTIHIVKLAKLFNDRVVISRRKLYLMKSKIIAIGIVVMLALAASVWAANIAGKWTADVQGSTVSLDLKVEGTTLTGTLENSQMPGAVDLKDGKIDGDNVSFTIVRKMGETEMKIVWKGKVVGDEIKFKREMAGGGGMMGGGMGGPGAGGPGAGGAAAAEEIVAKRVK
jgi:hypothetical protein